MRLLAAATLALIIWPAPVEYEIEKGIWSQYAEQPTEDMIWYHTEVTGLLENPEQYDAFIAVISCDLVGQEAWIQVEDSPWLHAAIFDCSGSRETTRWMVSNNIIGEIDYYTARRLGVPVGEGVKGKLIMGPADFILSPRLDFGTMDLSHMQ